MSNQEYISFWVFDVYETSLNIKENFLAYAKPIQAYVLLILK